MRQALHIFKKDVRQFRYLIGVILAWTAVLVVLDAQVWSDPSPSPNYFWAASGFSTYGLPIMWWLAVVLTMHAEALPGDRQFWLTRPYSRGSLFAAKALFVIAVILLPIFLAQAAILHFAGVSIAANFTRLLWEQVLITTILIVPAAAVASLTSALVPCVFLAILITFAAHAIQSEGASLGVFWVRAMLAVAALTLFGAIVLAWQYGRRGTTAARLIGAVGLIGSMAVAVFTPWRTVFGVQSQLSRDMPAVAVSVTPSASRLNLVAPARGIQVQFHVSGLSSDTPFVCRGHEVHIIGAGGAEWWARNTVGDGSVMPTGRQACGFGIPMPPRFLDSVSGSPVRMEAALYITVFGPPREHTIPMDGVWRDVPELGNCQGFKGTVNAQVECRQAFRELGVLAFPANSYSPYGSPFSYSPFPAALSIQPIVTEGYPFHIDTQSAVLATSAPIAHLRLEVDEDNVHLQEYEVGG